MKYFYKENSVLEKKIAIFFAKLSDWNQTYCNGELSILLLGSLSRGEGSWIVDDSGQFLIISDIEFFTIYPKGFKGFQEFLVYLAKLKEDIFFDQSSLLFHIDNTFVCKNGLRKIERKLLIFDAIKYGRILSGPNIIELFPKIDIHNINLFDIRDILTHRLFSVMYYGWELKRNGNLEQYRYNLAKNSLDLMTVLLTKKNILLSGNENKLRAIEKIIDEKCIINYFYYCLDIKLTMTSTYKFSIEEMENLFIEIIALSSKNFKMPIISIICNSKFIIRRKLGIVKRIIKYRYLPNNRQISTLINKFINKNELTEYDVMDNLILNGYPKISP